MLAPEEEKVPTKKPIASTRSVVEDAIELSKKSGQQSWHELLPVPDSRATYPAPSCNEQVPAVTQDNF